MLKDHLPLGFQEDLLDTCNIMTYELGAIVRSLIYADRHSGGPAEDKDKERAYLGSARIDLADLILQCRLIAEQAGWDYAELIDDGEERFLERMKEWKDGKLK